MADFPVLTTQRLVLRAFRDSDASAVFAIFSREAVTRFHNRERMCTIEEAQELVARRSGAWGRGAGARWAITLHGSDGAAIGSCGYYNVNRAFRSIEIGYDLHPAHWRQGIMTEALTAMLAYCFGEPFEFRLNRVEALTPGLPRSRAGYVAHAASIGLLIKLGFQEEGIRREYGFWKNQFHDLRSFSLLRREWEEWIRSRNTGTSSSRRRDDLAQEQPQPGPAVVGQRSSLRGWIL